ncbi:MAG: NUDIX hydrolase [Proteobacteria bacterium ST_bin14]|nr:MAG: NUDIX hydrolase [Proteobacteria bacterium ST_bin14]
MADDTQLPPAIPAATLVLFRDRADGPPDLLIVERARAMVFAGGALVFPGGRIDPEDYALAAIHIGDDEHGAARIAAIRETIEEAGIAVGLAPMPDAAQLTALRSGLHAGEPFGALLAGLGLSLDTAALVPFARWLPAHANMRIFDTLFFLAALPHGAPEPIVDATENSRVFWMSAQRVIDDADAGRATIIFPTRRNLERLAQFASFAAAVDHARSHPVTTVTPWVETRGAETLLCIPEGIGYPVTTEPMSGAMRG